MNTGNGEEESIEVAIYLLRVVGVEANLAVNMMAPCQHGMQEIGGDLGDGGLLGGMMAGVDGMVGIRVVSEYSP